MESLIFDILVNAINTCNRTDFGNLGKRICRANSLDNNRLDKIIINYTLSAKLITFYKLNCKFRRERVKINVIQNFLQTLSLFTRLKLNRLNKNTTC